MHTPLLLMAHSLETQVEHRCFMLAHRAAQTVLLIAPPPHNLPRKWKPSFKMRFHPHRLLSCVAVPSLFFPRRQEEGLTFYRLLAPNEKRSLKEDAKLASQASPPNFSCRVSCH